MSKPQSRALAIPEGNVTALREAVEAYGPAAMDGLDAIGRAVKVAEGLTLMRRALEPLKPLVLALSGSHLGFRTDRDTKGGYGEEDVLRCASEALLMGLELTGNQWNIFGGRVYVTREGFVKKLRDLPGLTDLEVIPAIPKVQEGGAVVRVQANWTYQGVKQTLTREFAIKLFPPQGADVAVGKADRKMRAAVFERITGTALGEGELDETPEAIAAPARPSLVARLRERQQPAEAPPSADATQAPGALFPGADTTNLDPLKNG